MREPLVFTYTNYRGEVSQRRVWPNHVVWQSTPWHEPQWILWAEDLDKGEQRAFAMKDISFVPPGSVPMPRNADEAVAMWLLGERWVREHAPERLRSDAPAPAPGVWTDAVGLIEENAWECGFNEGVEAAADMARSAWSDDHADAIRALKRAALAPAPAPGDEE